jgi:hypothetical protein
VKVRLVALSWFRGAAESAELETGDRSMVVFGENGAGKSCFVDAVEYVLRDGRIQHLAHEYSGRHQEKAVVNTHRPSGAATSVRIVLMDGTEVVAAVSESGSASIQREGDSPFEKLDCGKTVLRQDEVSHFVHSTKGEKYSVLLPLLGLGHLEAAAENFRQLGRAIRKQSGAKEAAAVHKRAASAFQSYQAAGTDKSAEDSIRALCDKFVPEAHDHSPERCMALVEPGLAKRLRDSSVLERRQAAIEGLARIDLRAAVTGVRAAASSVASAAHEAVVDRLRVLEAADGFLAGETPDEVIECPACGTRVKRAAMSAHVSSELAALEEIQKRAAEHRDAIRGWRKVAGQVGTACASKEISAWASEAQDERIAEAISAAVAYDPPGEEVGEAQLAESLDTLGPAIIAAAAAGSFLPPPATDLAHAQEELHAAGALLDASRQVADGAGAEALADRVAEIESEIRREINAKSRTVIDEISSDLQRFWGILHPGEPIEDVRLHVPADSDKAIDIALKFYGKELESPRLTLSEGYRNSLGLCVFLAMAARYGDGGTPILLDDVIVSLDRGHRGMVANLLHQEFADRQMLLFTHDRDWYSDLRQQLSASSWTFREMLPYATPAQGIRWAGRSSSLGDARGYLATRADTAANEARKVMDIELAMYCERLEVPLPFARGGRNDRRGAHEFLVGLRAVGEKKFQIRDGKTYKPNSIAIESFSEADGLLMTWGNRGSHSTDVTKAEAEQLIAACETALRSLSCAQCGKPVYHLENTRTRAKQCECGVLRWK